MHTFDFRLLCFVSRFFFFFCSLACAFVKLVSCRHFLNFVTFYLLLILAPCAFLFFNSTFLYLLFTRRCFHFSAMRFMIFRGFYSHHVSSLYSVFPVWPTLHMCAYRNQKIWNAKQQEHWGKLIFGVCTSSLIQKWKVGKENMVFTYTHISFHALTNKHTQKNIHLTQRKNRKKEGERERVNIEQYTKKKSHLVVVWHSLSIYFSFSQNDCCCLFFNDMKETRKKRRQSE